jgi:acetyl esterase/lipase
VFICGYNDFRDAASGGTLFKFFCLGILLTMRYLRYLIAIVLLCACTVHAADPAFTRQEDVIYGRKFGMALTMDVFHPTGPANGGAVVVAVSGGWFSSHEVIAAPQVQAMIEPMAERGYTVFAVVHGSQPRFTIPDAVADMNRSVRFIRFHAKDYGIDPNRIGITGGSAGGHLSLMMGVKPMLPDPKSPDPVEHVESNVQAVGCFFPPTDFLNYGAPDVVAWDTKLKWLLAPFDFQKQEKDGQFTLLMGDDKIAVAKEMSPIYWISAKTPPTLIIHGDADALVPLEQSQRFIAKLNDLKIPAQLVVRPGKNHGWPDTQPDLKLILDWFDQYMPAGAATTQPRK